MKILFVAVFTPNSTNVWQAKAFEQLGHEVIRFDYRQRPHQELMSYKGSDVVIYSKCNAMDVKWVNYFTCTLKVLWYMDAMHSFNKELKQKINACDLVFCSTDETVREAKKLNPNTFKNYGGYDVEIHKPLSINKDISVSFIGDISPQATVHKDRKKYHDKIKFNVIQGVYGLKHSHVVSRTKINLNFTETCGTSNRLYKLMAAGGFVLTTPYDGLENDFNIGVELDVFNSVKELREKIAYYLNHESLRNNIAENGRLKVKKYDHLHFAKRILNKI